MRDFDATQEPSGHKVRAKKSAELPFVIQKHAATRLHYDFRLGWNGVLKSWAVTRGPSYFPGDKRLAVQVEDHPLEYGGFEGIIPRGQYGGGTVMLWDRGTWEPHVDVDEGLRKGSLKFALHGKKMHGNWALVRMHPRPGERKGKPNWLLIKEHDKFERGQNDTPVTEEKTRSVLSRRDMDAIARAKDRVWQSNRAESKAPETEVTPIDSKQRAARSATSKSGDWSKNLRGAPKETLPKFISPQLASLSKEPPAGDRWVHEIKLDGYRIQARIHGEKVQLITRNGLDWTHRMKALAETIKRLPVKSALIDGEVVVLNAEGVSSFEQLQAAFQEGTKAKLVYFAFDLLHLDGHNLRNLPLIDRKRILEDVLAKSGEAESVRLSEHIEGDGAPIFKKACALGTEGIIAKLADGKYSPGRSGSWLKIKCYREQELVIGGFTLPTNGTHGIGALLLGYYREDELIYAGKSGTGFTQKTHKLMRDKLETLRVAKNPFAKIPREVLRDALWVKPEMVAQVSFSNWTADRLVRQAAFKGLREDKPAKSVVLEEVQKETKASAGKKVRTMTAKKETAAATRASKSDASDLPIKLTHPEKVLDAASGVTKEQLARYYLEVSSAMLPHVEDRPLTLVRCVDGSGKPCFYQKHRKETMPGLDSVDVPNRKTGATEPYITLSTSKALVQLAQIGVLEVHPWGSHNETMEQPDRIIIDLDPDAAIDWQTIAASAKEVRKRLQKLGLKSFVKSTGGKGLHVVAPIRPEHEWPEVKKFTHQFVLALEKDFPERFLTKMTKSARVGKIFLDYLRNDRGATAVAPYSPRARAGLPVALPLSWSELDEKEPPLYHVADIQAWRKRLARDPWKEMPRLDQRLKLA